MLYGEKIDGYTLAACERLAHLPSTITGAIVDVSRCWRSGDVVLCLQGDSKVVDVARSRDDDGVILGKVIKLFCNDI